MARRDEVDGVPRGRTHRRAAAAGELRHERPSPLSQPSAGCHDAVDRAVVAGAEERVEALAIRGRVDAAVVAGATSGRASSRTNCRRRRPSAGSDELVVAELHRRARARDLVHEAVEAGGGAVVHRVGRASGERQRRTTADERGSWDRSVAHGTMPDMLTTLTAAHALAVEPVAARLSSRRVLRVGRPCERPRRDLRARPLAQRARLRRARRGARPTHRVLAVDMPGRGASQWLPDPNDYVLPDLPHDADRADRAQRRRRASPGSARRWARCSAW